MLLLTQLLTTAALLGACYALFGALARLFPCNPDQPVFFSKSIGLDLGWGVLGMLYAGVGPTLGALLTASPFGDPSTSVTGRWLAAAPIWAEVAILLLATDFCQYWLHRAFHGSALWSFHAVHHSAEEINWTTVFRSHPVNYLGASASMSVAARLVGFSELSLLLAAPLFFLSGVIAHANLNWTFGPLRFVVASPVFHRWHHSLDEDMRERNFAPMFPVWDLMFGTFRMPRGERPGRFGAEGVPSGLIGQLIYPIWRGDAPLSAQALNRTPEKDA